MLRVDLLFEDSNTVTTLAEKEGCRRFVSSLVILLLCRFSPKCRTRGSPRKSVVTARAQGRGAGRGPTSVTTENSANNPIDIRTNPYLIHHNYSGTG
jgi:hypothetical protein